MTQFKLIIGNKTYSSRSLRPWVLMKHFEIPFEEQLVKLDLPGTTAEILKYSPSGRVPALLDGETTVWDSLAICGGPFLCGEFGIVDAMFAPVVGRFDTYDVKLAGAARDYTARVKALPAMRAWYAGAQAEDFVAADHEL